MDLLARREHSRQELLQKLQRRVENIALLEASLDSLVEDNLLSDERFCEAFVRSRMNNGYGPVRIKAELKARGVSEQWLTQYLNPQADDWLERLAELVQRKFGSDEAPDLKSLAKRQRFLQQRGYTYEQINRVLRQNKPD
ncbi:MAG: recombination regulator RecX [Pseudomonadales bacterium]|nr:recombination regulator RecX [Pseudomonadales bacterium]